MTDVLVDPLPRHRWPRRGRAPLGPDVAVGFSLLVIDALAFLWQEARYGLVGWAGDVSRADLDAAQLTSIAWTQRILIAVLVLAGSAVLLRAPVTLVSQLIAAAALAFLLMVAQKDYADTHPAPTPTPSVQVAPCYSGSNGPTCH